VKGVLGAWCSERSIRDVRYRHKADIREPPNNGRCGGKADITQTRCNVCSWPKADVANQTGFFNRILPDR
jgi:hypothetical protein